MPAQHNIEQAIANDVEHIEYNSWIYKSGWNVTGWMPICVRHNDYNMHVL